MQTKTGIFYIALTLFLISKTNAVTPTYRVRPQGNDRVHQMVGVSSPNFAYQSDGLAGTFSVLPVLTHSFDAFQIGKSLFGCDAIKCDGGAMIKIEGGDYQGSNRDPRAWLADNFFLPTNFKSNVFFKPKIKSTMIDLIAYFDWNNFVPGLYCQINAPMVHTSWNLNYKECVINRGANDFPLGYVAPINFSEITQFDVTLFHSFSEYITNQNFIPPASGINPVVTVNYGQMFAKNSSKTAIADVTLEIGKNFYERDNAQASIYGHMIIPTGTRHNPILLFDPQIGNNHHIGLGGGIKGHYIAWNQEEKDRMISIYGDINLTHLLTNHQVRTFDLKNKPMSRYMLAAQFSPMPLDASGVPPLGLPIDPIDGDLLHGDSETAIFRFLPFGPAVYTPVTNLTTTKVSVSIPIQADIVALANYTSGSWSIDAGYNLWVQSCEKIKCPTGNPCANTTGHIKSLFNAGPNQYWALKGDARMWGFVRGGAANEFAPLSATESNADIHNGTNKVPTGTAPLSNTNQNVDNPELAHSDAIIYDVLPGSNVQINTSIQPVLLSKDDVDIVGSRALSQKIFAHVSRSCQTERLIAFFGCGGDLEWSMQKTSSSCSGCERATPSQWSIWFKTGLQFN